MFFSDFLNIWNLFLESIVQHSVPIAAYQFQSLDTITKGAAHRQMRLMKNMDL